MLNYANLNDVEFEALCRDIMSRKLGVELRRFAPGKDAGVDLTDDAHEKSIVVQVKHYQNSDVATLIRNLKKELDKVRKLAPKKYYICCSRKLSWSQIDDLYQHFGAYMQSTENIITLQEIDDFLKESANRDILKKHFKLWLDDMGLVKEIIGDRIFADCQALLRQIRREHGRFVSTAPYREALQCLQENRVLILVGNPGVGKTTTSKMLVLHYAIQGYRVRYTSATTQTSLLKASLDPDPESKEVILLDDCFGQAYFEMSYTQSGELVDLVSYVNDCPNKVLILNSRDTIYLEAKERQRALSESLQYGEYRVHRIDIKRVTPDERLEILRTHMAFGQIPEDYVDYIMEKHRYTKIIEHNNFNPRIIEFVCSHDRYREKQPNQYYDFICEHLDNPREMWNEEYEERLLPVDRILLQTVYSLTAYTIYLDLVRACFERRIAGIPSIDKTKNQFDSAMRRLVGSMLRLEEEQGHLYVAVVNPSVNDFLDHHLMKTPSSKQELVDSICTVEQMLRLVPDEIFWKEIEGLITTGKIDEYIITSRKDAGRRYSDEYLDNRETLIAWCILQNRLFIQEYKNVIYQFLGNMQEMYFTYSPGVHRIYELPKVERYEQVLPILLERDFWEFYDLEAYFSDINHIRNFLNHFKEINQKMQFVLRSLQLFRPDTRQVYINNLLEIFQDK